MFNLFKNFSRKKRILDQIEVLKAKSELIKAKGAIYNAQRAKPTKYEKLTNEIADLGELKDVIGSGDVNKWLKMLENPLVMQLLMKFLMSKGVDQNTTISGAIDKLKPK